MSQINLMFHDVKLNPSRWNTTPSRFREMIEIIVGHKNKVTITVDDAGRGNFEYMMPIFCEFQLKAYIFVPTFYISKGGNTSKYMTESQIKAFSDEGHIIGSHSHNHPKNISILSSKEILDEWKISKDILEGITQKEVTSCSIPGGFYSQKQFQILVDLGYQEIFTSMPTFQVRKRSDIQLYGRFSIERETSNQQLEAIMNMDVFYQKKLRLRQSLSQNLYTLKHKLFQ
jgi:peptidoglycan/xylan/chitin deacetylase (PgdA/CDA1 family)